MWKRERPADTLGAKMNTVTENHKVVLRNTRNVKIERSYGHLTHDQIALLIAETHGLDNGLRVVEVWHSDGSRCESLAKVVA
jgi:hypothetical protein